MFLAEHLRYDLPRLRHLLEDARSGMTAQGAPVAQVSGLSCSVLMIFVVVCALSHRAHSILSP